MWRRAPHLGDVATPATCHVPHLIWIVTCVQMNVYIYNGCPNVLKHDSMSSLYTLPVDSTGNVYTEACLGAPEPRHLPEVLRHYRRYFHTIVHIHLTFTLKL